MRKNLFEFEETESIRPLLEKMKIQFDERWGSGQPGSIWSEHKVRGKRNIRKGIPAVVLLAAAVDPRFKRLKSLHEVDRAEIIQVIIYICCCYMTYSRKLIGT